MQSHTTTYMSDHRFTRVTTWATLWLQAFAVVLLTLSAFDAADAHDALRRMSRRIGNLITLRAANFIRWPKRGARQFGRLKRASLSRTFIGAALRKRLRSNSIIALFFALLRVMRDLDMLIARQARRLAKGLTRVCPRRPSAHDYQSVAVITRAPAIAPADSS